MSKMICTSSRVAARTSHLWLCCMLSRCFVFEERIQNTRLLSRIFIYVPLHMYIYTIYILHTGGWEADFSRHHTRKSEREDVDHQAHDSRLCRNSIHKRTVWRLIQRTLVLRKKGQHGASNKIKKQKEALMKARTVL